MAFQPVDHGIHGVVNFRLHNQLVQTGFWFKYDGANGAPHLALAINTMRNWWLRARESLSNELMVISYKATDEYTENGLGITVPEIVSPTGARTALSLPGNCAICQSYKSAATNQSAQGRGYVPGVPTDTVVAGMISQGIRDVLTSAAINILGELAGTALTWATASRFHNKVQRPLGVMTPVDNVVIDIPLDSQRRRLPGRGN